MICSITNISLNSVLTCHKSFVIYVKETREQPTPQQKGNKDSLTNGFLTIFSLRICLLVESKIIDCVPDVNFNDGLKILI